MNPATRLATTLVLLAEALDDPDADLSADIALLSQEAHQAVPSFLGFTITIALQPDTVAITVPPAPWQLTPRASMHFEIDAATSVREVEDKAAVAITFYAGTPGAFVDLSADVAFLFGLPLTDIAMDQPMPESKPGPAETRIDPTPADAITVGDLSVINQAIGFLIGQGHEPDQARQTLTRNALTAGTTVAAAAALIIAAAQN